LTRSRSKEKVDTRRTTDDGRWTLRQVS